MSPSDAQAGFCAYCFADAMSAGRCRNCHSEEFDHEKAGALRPGTVLRGSYQVGHMLGAGNFGKTYRARHLQMGKLYVLKELFPEGLVQREAATGRVVAMDRFRADRLALSRESFLKEARTLAEIDGEKNPEIVKVYDFFEANGTAYIVMPYLSGRTLGDRIGEEGALSEPATVHVLRVILRALRVAHRAGILHQDVKPENVYLVDDQRPVLIDFGNARMAGVQAGRQAGTPGYAPPEQRSGAMRENGDIYALGATVYACLTARAPADAPDRVAGTPLSPSIASLRGKVSELLLDFVEKAMQLRPEDRYASIDEVFQHLKPLLAPVQDWVSLLPPSRLSAQLAKVQANLQAGRKYALMWSTPAALLSSLWFLAHRMVPWGLASAAIEIVLVAGLAFAGEFWFAWLLPLVLVRLTSGLLGPWLLYRDLAQHVVQLRASGSSQSESLARALKARMQASPGLVLAGIAAGPVAFFAAFALAELDMEAARAKVAMDIRVDRLMCKIEEHVKATRLPPSKAEIGLSADQIGGLVQSYELEDAHILLRLKEPAAVAGRAIRLSFDPAKGKHTRCENVDLPDDWVPPACRPGGGFVQAKCD